MRSSNPVLSEKRFAAAYAEPIEAGNAMTIDGTIGKTSILLGLILLSGSYTWGMALEGNPMAWAIGGAIVGFLCTIVTFWLGKFSWAPVIAPVYAVAEGLLLGAVSSMFALAYDGIVVQAVGLTLSVLAVMLIAYRTRLIVVTDKFRSIMGVAVGAIFLLYIVNFVMRFFGTGIPFIHSSGTFGIVFSVIVVGIASFMLLLDFDFIERSVERGSPKYMEWAGAMGLMVTLVWLYLEMLRLLAKLRSD